MQREVINGIPFVCDKANKLYIFDPHAAPGTAPFQIGTKTTDGYQLNEGWEQKFQERLTAWRTDLKPRSRKPVTNNKTTTPTNR
jgi:hypothetical protein